MPIAYEKKTAIKHRWVNHTDEELVAAKIAKAEELEKLGFDNLAMAHREDARRIVAPVVRGRRS